MHFNKCIPLTLFLILHSSSKLIAHMLSLRQIIEAWDSVDDVSITKQILHILHIAYPNYSIAELGEMNLGKRNYLILKLRENLINDKINCSVKCNKCDTLLEFTLSTKNFNSCNEQLPYYVFQYKDYLIKFRLLNSHDLIAVECFNGLEQAAIEIFKRCIIEAQYKKEEINLSDIPNEIIQELETEIINIDPLLEIDLELCCGNCQHTWQSPLAIASFFCNEFSMLAKKMLHEIHCLALAYGWSEQAIITMSQKRRHYYLEKLKL